MTWLAAQEALARSSGTTKVPWHYAQPRKLRAVCLKIPRRQLQTRARPQELLANKGAVARNSKVRGFSMRLCDIGPHLMILVAVRQTSADQIASCSAFRKTSSPAARCHADFGMLAKHSCMPKLTYEESACPFAKHFKIRFSIALALRHQLPGLLEPAEALCNASSSRAWRRVMKFSDA